MQLDRRDALKLSAGLALTAALGFFEVEQGVAPGPFAIGDVTGDGFELFEFGTDDFSHVAAIEVLPFQLVGALQTLPRLGDLADEHTFERVSRR